MKKIYWFFQRGKRGWADCDTWDLYSYLARVIKGSVKHLKDSKMGTPTIMFDSPKCDDPQDTRRAIQKWQDILENIIWSFDMYEKVANGDVHVYCPGQSEELNKDWAKKLEEIDKRYGMPIHYMEKYEYEKMMRGFDYLRDYFSCLWD